MEGSQRWAEPAAAQSGLSQRRAVPLALAEGSFRGLRRARSGEGDGAALPRATRRALAAGVGGGGGGGGWSPGNRCVPRPAGCFQPCRPGSGKSL